MAHHRFSTAWSRDGRTWPLSEIFYTLLITAAVFAVGLTWVCNMAASTTEIED